MALKRSEGNSNVEDHTVVSREDWLKARKKLLLKEKKFTRIQDDLSLERRRLPLGQSYEEVRIRRTQGRRNISRSL